MHERIKAVACVGGVAALVGQSYMTDMEVAESEDVLLAQHHTFRSTCGAGRIKQYKRVLAVVSGCVTTHIFQPLCRIGAVKRHSRHTRFGYGERHYHHLLVARNGIADYVFAAAHRVLRVYGV